MYAIGSEIVVDKVYDYARLEDAIADLCQRFGLGDSLAMPRRREYVSNRPHYSSY